MREYVISGGQIVSQDPEIGRLDRGDVHVKNGRIVAVGTELDDPGCEYIDASGKVVLPGLVNAHVHLWETQLLGIGSNWVGDDYFELVHQGLVPAFTSEDSFRSTWLGARGQLSAGTTTVFDWCHNNSTPEHSDASIEALRASGIRAAFGHGTVKVRRADQPHFSTVPHPRAEAERLRGELENDPRVSLRLCILGPDYSTLAVTREDLALSRELDVPTSAHVWGASNRVVSEGYRELTAELGGAPRHNIVHGNSFEDDELRLLIDAGASFTGTPFAEIRDTPFRPLLSRIARLGGIPSLGIDSELMSSGSLLGTMRRALDVERCFDAFEVHVAYLGGDAEMLRRKEERSTTIANAGGSLEARVRTSTEDVLHWATMGGAYALALEDRIGSVTPGKLADLVLIDASRAAGFPLMDPVSFVVDHVTESEIDTVLVGGEIVKRDGQMLHADRYESEWHRARVRNRELFSMVEGLDPRRFLTPSHHSMRR